METAIDLKSIRQEFPFLQSHPHLCYLDNAATTQKPQAVINAVSNFSAAPVGNPGRGSHQLARNTATAYEAARASVAQFLNAHPNEIIFTSNTTAGINQVAHMIRPRIQKDDLILLTISEHHSNLLPWQRLAQETAAHLRYIPLDQDLALDLSYIDDLNQQRIALLVAPLITNVTGRIYPIQEIIQQLKAHQPDLISVVDAAQAAAHTPIDVTCLDCDFLAFSGHKMYGPMGIGVLYGRNELLRELMNEHTPMQLGGGMIKSVDRKTFTPAAPPHAFEAGTPNVAGAIGLQAAIAYIHQIGFPSITNHELYLTRYCIEQLNHCNTPGLTLLTSLSNLEHARQSSMISLYVDGLSTEDLATFLDDDQIIVRSGMHCAHPLHQEVIQHDTLRISFGIYNTSAEVDQLVSSLEEANQLLSR